jgi:hypothetical protein
MARQGGKLRDPVAEASFTVARGREPSSLAALADGPTRAVFPVHHVCWLMQREAQFSSEVAAHMARLVPAIHSST